MSKRWTRTERQVLLSQMHNRPKTLESFDKVGEMIGRSGASARAKYYSILKGKDSINVTKINNPKPNNSMSTFVDKLKRGNKELQEDRAERLGKITKSALDNKISSLENKKLELEDELDEQLEITATNDANTIKNIKEWNASEFVNRRVEIKVKLKNLEMNLEAAREVKQTLFGG